MLAEAERLRIVYMKEDQRGDAGYTPDELREITAYLRDIGSDSDVDDLTHEDMQALIELIRDQKRSRGLSFADSKNCEPADDLLPQAWAVSGACACQHRKLRSFYLHCHGRAFRSA